MALEPVTVYSNRELAEAVPILGKHCTVMTSIFQTLRGTTIRTGSRLSLRPINININININRNLINITSRTLFIATVSASAILLSHHNKPVRALIIGQTASATPSSCSSLKFATHSSSNVLGASDSDRDIMGIMGNNRDGHEIIRNNNDIDIDIDTKNHKKIKKKTVEELRIQWKGGRDVWPKVPLLPEEIIEAPSVSVDGDRDADADADAVVVGLNTTKYISIQTRVKVNNDDFEKSMSYSTRNSNDIHKTIKRQKRTPPWPQIIQEYTLFGFGAYNPRGQEAPDDVNERQHDLLRQDIQSALSRYTTIYTHGNTNANTYTLTDTDTNTMMATYWDSAAIWEDGSSEEGFIVAFRNNGVPSSSSSSSSSSSLHVQEGLQMSIELARKYDQGAIYKYTYEYRHGNDFAERGGGGGRGSLIRDTIAVMDEGSEATVEVEIDPDCMN